MNRALILGILASACGGSTDRSAPSPRTEAAPAVSSQTHAPTPPPVAPPADPPIDSVEAPGLASWASSLPNVPQVPAQLEPVPEDAEPVVVTVSEVRLREVAVPLAPRSLPTKQALDPIAAALAESEATVVIAAEAAVSAGALRRVVSLIPRDRPRVLLARGADGAKGVIPLSLQTAAAAPEVTVAADGFHVAERVGGPQVHLEPPVEGGDPFDYVALRNKAKAFRAKNPDIDGVRVGVEPDVAVGVLLRALSQIRGPKCTTDAQRCWLPQLELGEDVRTSRPGTTEDTTPKIAFPKAGEGDTSAGEVTIGAATVPDTLDADDVRRVLKRRVGYARMCYFAALADEPGLGGKVVLRLTVDANGDVEEVGVPSRTMKSIAVEDCLERGVAGLKFAAPTKAPAMVDVPLTFSVK